MIAIQVTIFMHNIFDNQNANMYKSYGKKIKKLQSRIFIFLDQLYSKLSVGGRWLRKREEGYHHRSKPFDC